MTVRLEPLRLGESIDGGRHASLEGRGRCDIDDLSATGAEEMVVVFCELLGKLIASELVVGGDAPDHACDLEIDEVSISGAPGQIRSPISDVADADRVARAYE